MLAEPIIRRLRLRMVELYGRTWTSVHGEGVDGGSADTWAKGLAGLTPAQIANGLDACAASGDDWPPSLPRFRKLCLGIPSLGVVRYELRPDSHRSPFAILVASLMDWHRHRQATGDHADRMIADAYELAVEHVMRGGDLPGTPAGELGHEKPRKPVVPESAEERERVLARARAEAGLSGRDLAAGEGVA